MWLRRSEYERLVSESALALQVPKLELRAELAESALATERSENSRAQRHWASMWLRHMRSIPLPPTVAEKAEIKAEKERKSQEPPQLNADQQARLQASIEWGKRNGFTEEQATKSFMAQLATQSDE